MNRKLNQKGFSLVEGLLLIIALALIVFVGYYVWHSQKEANDTLDTAAKTSQAATPSTSSKKAVTVASDATLQAFMVKSCGTDNETSIKAMFANKGAQNVETDNYKIDGNYAIANVKCTPANATELSTEFLKFSNGSWSFATTSPEVGCTYLTNQGFPDALKAPYCQNTEGSFIQ